MILTAKQETIIKAINEKLDKMTYEEREIFLEKMGFVFEEKQEKPKKKQKRIAT